MLTGALAILKNFFFPFIHVDQARVGCARPAVWLLIFLDLLAGWNITLPSFQIGEHQDKKEHGQKAVDKISKNGCVQFNENDWQISCSGNGQKIKPESAKQNQQYKHVLVNV